MHLPPLYDEVRLLAIHSQHQTCLFHWHECLFHLDWVIGGAAKVIVHLSLCLCVSQLNVSVQCSDISQIIVSVQCVLSQGRSELQLKV